MINIIFCGFGKLTGKTSHYTPLTSILAVLLMGSIFSNVQAEESQAVVLMYHHFGVDEHPSTNISLAQFDAHLNHLSQMGYQVWPLAKVIDHVSKKKPFPTRVVAITIDDAYRSVFDEAYPRLRKRGWPFTVFVSTEGVDQRFRAYMSWQQMREMQQYGATFENHSATHDYLIRRRTNETTDQWHQRMRDDITHAQRRIREELGRAPVFFAYPYGEYNEALAELVKEMGLVAFGQQSGPVGFNADFRALPRFPIAERFSALPGFKQKLQSLAFPIMEVQPWEPVVTEENAPRMEVKLAKSDAQLDQLACFVSGQGAIAIEWLDRKARHFAVQAPTALSRGRSRYNCTAPSSQPGRYFWFSHLWIVP